MIDLRRRPLAFAALAGSAACLAACAGVTDPTPPRLGLPDAYEAPPTGPDAPLDRWWTAFDDPQLTALVERALARNPSVREALARVSEARAQRAANLSRFGLQGDLTSSAERRDADVDGADVGTGIVQAGVSDIASADFQVSWELDLFGRGAVARRGADADVAGARFAAEAARATLAAETALALFAARAAAAQLEDAGDAERIQAELTRIATRRADRGLAARADAARVSSEAARAAARRRGLEAERQAAIRALLVLAGDPGSPTSSIPVVSDLGTPPPAPLALPADLLTRRPDVREAEARLQAATAGLQAARLDLFPRLTLRPGLGVSRQEADAFTAASRYWSIGLGLTAPVFDRARLLAETKASGARAEAAAAAYERTVAAAFSEADQTLVRLAADRDAVALQENAERDARLAYEAAHRRFLTGLEDLEPVLDAEARWREARTQRLEARAQALRRAVQAFQALGGGWDASSSISAEATP